MTKRFKTACAAAALCAAAPAAHAAQVFATDLIVQGSTCIGIDCSSSESFGFDTLRLKENNLRIHFDDTSNSGSFPSNDWRIVINGSNNGDPSFFVVQDATSTRNVFKIEAGASTNALVVGDNGHIGMGTDTPVVEMHTVDGDTPTLRLEQDGSSGFAQRTWDVAGNETNFFVRDVTGGSALVFRVKAGAPDNAIYVENDGKVGFGTESPTAGLDIRTNETFAVKAVGTGLKLADMESTDGGAIQYRMVSDSDNRRVVALNGAGQVQSQILFKNEEVHIAGRTDNGANLFAVIDGNGIRTLGPDCSPAPCDRTFDLDFFEVPTIEEHAAYMWENQHLKAVGPTKPGEFFNVTQKTGGILHELEVAHIYIEQLNERIKRLEAAR